MKSTHTIITCLATLMFATSAAAQTGQRGGICFTIGSAIRGSETPLLCPHIGETTIDDVYAKGFRVVQVFPINPRDSLSKLGVIIEEQKP